MPYIDDLFSVGKVANGFILTVSIPYSVIEVAEGKSKDKDMPQPVSASEDQNPAFFAKDEKALSRLVSKLLPDLAKAKTKADYDSAFKEATGK